ncbi:MBL fold metallo-hydrolase [uncultured Williamsia sp.]|uniref:MBL fold metallo-hydrolase n=1 Tax=uncultured Williamsia sp. TaxID=259311 RepID=UPI002621989A|nr:MBL fold metallo-hydrolase [uncultured Williamsia sp.]
MAIADFGRILHIHHLDGATFRPAPFVRLPTHVVVMECDQGIVLVDTGLGVADMRHTTRRLGPFVYPLAPVLDESRTVLRQLEALGFRAEDVTDIVATHLDYDHIGGASDFPTARVHVSAPELEAAFTRVGPRARIRYRRVHLDALGETTAYGETDTQVLGLAGHCIDTREQVYLVPMPGHTHGHAAVVIQDPARGWLIAAGDAAMHRNSITPGPAAPWPARAAERALAMNTGRVAENHHLLSELAAKGHRVFCSHDSVQLATLRAESALIAPSPP